MTEYINRKPASSSLAKYGAVAGSVALGLNLLGINPLGNAGEVPAGGIFRGNAYAAPANAYVSWREMEMTQQLAYKDSVIAAQASEKYAQTIVDAKVTPLYDEICALKTAAAVNAARDQDYRCYVEREFVHQPKVHFNNRVVETRRDDCCCDDRGNERDN